MSRSLFAAIVLFASPAFAETRYFSEISDVPLPAGFAERDAAVGFGDEGDRLVMAQAEGEAAANAVRAFYVEALPPLGWSQSPNGDEALVFLRGRERLTLSVSSVGAHTRLHAGLVIRGASMSPD